MNLNRRRLLRRVTAFPTYVLAVFAAISCSSAGIVSFADVKVLGSSLAPGVHLGDQISSLNPFIFPEVSSGVVPAGRRAVDHKGSDVLAVAVYE